MLILFPSICYYDYLRSSDKKPRTIFILVISILTTAVFLSASLLILLLSITVRIISILTYIILFIILLSINRLYRRKFKCLEERFFTIDGVEFIICYGGPVGAWFDARKRKIYMSDKLLKVLNEEELKAVYFHEEGHKKYHVLLEIASTGGSFWLLFLAFIMAISLGKESNLIDIAVGESLFIFMFLILLTSSILSMIMLWYWLNEHEADVYSSKKIGVKPLISALVKIYTYKRLEEGFQRYSIELCFKLDIHHLNLITDYSLRDVVTLLFSKTFLEALEAEDLTKIFTKPLPETHH